MNRRSLLLSFLGFFMAKRSYFTPEAARKIAATVRKVEGQQVQPLRNRGAGPVLSPGYRVLVCKTTEAATSGNPSTCEIWDGDTPAEHVATGENIEVYFRIGDADSGVFVYVLETMRGYEALAKACP